MDPRTIRFNDKSGSTDISALFPEAHVDAAFRKRFTAYGPVWHVEDTILVVMRLAGRLIDQQVLEAVALDEKRVYNMWSFLDHMARDGRALLEIPEGETEVNILLGWDKSADKVYFLECEIEGGVRKINLKVRSPRNLANDMVLIPFD